eukprot:TRINITY_DN27626_c0_g1_i1.p1 TRINITY_DN27626_c0_g1~~TRINITY_DN27626_c0_g1_i1.p1  ORF type:complete len:128 (-),score=12.96 TRINITY_DN27626_c0_g1_i1:71-454(-)
MKKKVTRYPGICLDSRGIDQTLGEKIVNKNWAEYERYHQYLYAEDCLKACNDPTGPYFAELTGCEFHATEKKSDIYKVKNTCLMHTEEVVSGGGNLTARTAGGRHTQTCFVFEKKGKKRRVMSLISQ